MRYFKTICALFSVTFLSSCGGSDSLGPADNSLDREPILIHWADNIVKPAYNNFKNDFDAMATATTTFASTPDETNLIALRTAWVNAYVEWQKVELFEFGPADRYSLRNYFNIYPTSVEGIIANINDPSIALDVPSSYARQGFPALDYLMNGVGANDAEIVAYYTDEIEGAKRIAYLERLIERMNLLLTNVINGWNGTDRDTFVSSTGLDIGSSMGKVVNAYVLHFERYIRSGKIAIPSGSMVSGPGTPLPEKLEAYYKGDISKTLAKTAHEAAVNFFNGVSITMSEEGPSFKSYLDALEAKDETSGTLLSTIINNQFDVISTHINALDENFIDQINTDNTAMYDTYIEMQKAVVMLKIDMTSAMSVTITYTDNDGD
jgi:predicted lipoprotein